MSDQPELISQTQKNRFRWIAAISVLEAFITLVVLFSIPPDPKNAFLFGLSWKRWLIVLVTILIFARSIAWFFQPQSLHRYAEKYLQNPKTSQFIEISGIVVGILLWLALWFPGQRLGALSDDYSRVRPLLILFLLISMQFILVLKSLRNATGREPVLRQIKAHRKEFLVVVSSFLIIAITFAFLHFQKVAIGSPDALYFPASSILTPLQIYTAWVIFYLLQIFSSSAKLSWFQQPKWHLLGLIMIWLVTFLIWNGTPLPCTGDRPGPDTPNNLCYPSIDDSVYSIGSLYVGLGQGVHNHWLTDKPLYLVFLAIGQAIFGANIDRYLIFQVAVLASIPMLMYLFTKRLLQFSGGLLIAALMVLKGSNEIRLYSSVGGMNVKIENTEGLMTLLLLLFAMAAFYWFKKPEKPVWGVITGGILGLGTLVRFNPLAIMPIIFGMFIWINKRNLKKVSLAGSLFLATFFLTIMPWFVTARDENGVSFYYQKIQEVIDLRFNKPTGFDTESGSGHLASPSLTQMQIVEPKSSQGKDFILHFLNNEYQSLVELPVNIRFQSGEVIGAQKIWDIDPLAPFWLMDLTLENVFAISINLIFVLVGIILLFQKHGLVGLLPFMIQTGYFLGSSAAMTSGERYLMPVGWVTLTYYSVGLMWSISTLSRLFFSKQLAPFFFTNSQMETKDEPDIHKQLGYPVALWMSLFLIVGATPYLVNFLPDNLPAERSESLNQQAFQWLSDSGTVTQTQWEDFIKDPNALVISAKAYHPKNYRNRNYFPGHVLFEIMALGRDYVVVSHVVDSEAKDYFSDGSDVILVGCKTGQDEIWNSKRVLMKTKVVIQTNAEMNMILSPDITWSCP
ncbi:MAG: hypothetical protein ACYDH1_11065 [Anaerolineaceae bacterium]